MNNQLYLWCHIFETEEITIFKLPIGERIISDDSNDHHHHRHHHNQDHVDENDDQDKTATSSCIYISSFNKK